MDPTERALKQVTTTQIEEAISKTLSELVGKEYTAEVLNIDFNPIQNSSITDTVEIRLRLSRECVESDQETRTGRSRRTETRAGQDKAKQRSPLHRTRLAKLSAARHGPK